jgi:hypothetical protein
MNDALSRQIGGDHYKGGGIQPVELGYANRYCDCIFSAIKYLTRHPNKHHSLDLAKASHFVDLRLEMIAKHGLLSGIEVIKIEDYNASNGITGLNASIIADLHYWSVRLPKPVPTNGEMAEFIKAKIVALNTEMYGGHNG